VHEPENGVIGPKPPDVYRAAQKVTSFSTSSSGLAIHHDSIFNAIPAKPFPALSIFIFTFALISAISRLNVFGFLLGI